jgi:hypothetical protein
MRAPTALRAPSIAPSLVLSWKLDIVESLRARWFLIHALVLGAMVLAVARRPRASRWAECL